MRFVIQVKTKRPIEDMSIQSIISNRGLDISKNKIITGLAEDFDMLSIYKSNHPVIAEICDNVSNGNYIWL